MKRLRTIDLETTGFAPPAEICEVAFIDFDEELNELARYQSLIKPFDAIPAEARAVHHIGPRDVESAPRWQQARFHIKVTYPSPDILIAHNSEFERQWFSEIWPKAKWLCTWKSALRVWPNAPKHSNSVLRYHLGLDVPVDPTMPAHRALQDCVVTAKVLCELRKHASFDEMITWETEQPILPFVPLGRYRGQKWPDVPIDYLEWIGRSDLGEDIKFNASQELASRAATHALQS
jgi:exodeoxyribonuclease X